MFRCSESASCNAGGVLGTCEDTGFCSFPDTTCPSGRRYGEFAGSGFAGGCVPDDPVGSTSFDTDSGGGTTGSVSTTLTSDTSASGPTTEMSATGVSTTNTVDDSGATDPTSASNPTALTDPTDPTGASDPTMGDSTGTGDETTGESMMTGDPPGPECANFTWETTLGAGTSVPSADFFGDVFDTDCGEPGGSDIVWYWVAQNNDTYLFTTTAPQGLDLVISLYDDCDGTEQACTATNQLEVDAVTGQEYFFVVNAYGDTSLGYSVSFSVQ